MEWLNLVTLAQGSLSASALQLWYLIPINMQLLKSLVFFLGCMISRSTLKTTARESTACALSQACFSGLANCMKKWPSFWKTQHFSYCCSTFLGVGWSCFRLWFHWLITEPVTGPALMILFSPHLHSFFPGFYGQVPLCQLSSCLEECTLQEEPSRAALGTVHSPLLVTPSDVIASLTPLFNCS